MIKLNFMNNNYWNKMNLLKNKINQKLENILKI